MLSLLALRLRNALVSAPRPTRISNNVGAEEESHEDLSSRIHSAVRRRAGLALGSGSIASGRAERPRRPRRDPAAQHRDAAAQAGWLRARIYPAGGRIG